MHELTYTQVGILFFILLVIVAYPAIKEAWKGGKR